MCARTDTRQSPRGERKVQGQRAGLPFYNTSLYSLATLGATKTKSNLDAYIAGFSDNARVIFDQFNFTDTIARLARADILFKICQNFANTDLHPDAVPDRVMSNIYEHLIRRFGAEVNEAAEDFMTPRDVVHLATTLLLDPDDALFRNNPGLIRTLYDPTCGTGGFLTDAMNHVDGFTAKSKAPPVLIPFGQELELATRVSRPSFNLHITTDKSASVQRYAERSVEGCSKWRDRTQHSSGRILARQRSSEPHTFGSKSLGVTLSA